MGVGKYGREDVIIMRQITVITTFIHEMSFLVDKGISFSIEEVNSHIENKDVVDWLEKEFPFDSQKGIDFSLFRQSHREYIHEKLESIWGGYAGQERRKWGITNNGLCLLISWSIEIVRDIYGRDDGLRNDEEWIRD